MESSKVQNRIDSGSLKWLHAGFTQGTATEFQNIEFSPFQYHISTQMIRLRNIRVFSFLILTSLNKSISLATGELRVL